MTVYTFDQSDGPLDASWTVTGDTAAVVNNEVVNTGAGTGSSTIVLSTGTVGNDQSITMTIGSIDLTKDDPGATGVGILARIDSPITTNWYDLFIYGGSLSDPTWTWNLTSLSGPLNADATAPTPVEGMVIKMQVIGTSIKVYADDVIVHDITNTEVTTGGYYGFTTSQGINIEQYEITTSVAQTFTPPSISENPPVFPDKMDPQQTPLGWRLFRFYRARPAGINVYLYKAGSVSATAFGRVTDADPTTTYDNNGNAVSNGWDDIETVFWGGHAPVEVTADQAAALTAAGYTVT